MRIISTNIEIDISPSRIIVVKYDISSDYILCDILDFSLSKLYNSKQISDDNSKYPVLSAFKDSEEFVVCYTNLSNPSNPPQEEVYFFILNTTLHQVLGKMKVNSTVADSWA